MTRKPYFGFNHWLIIICITFVSLSYLVLYVAVNSLPAPSTLAAVAWNVETVDASAGIAGDGISMAFDASGLPAVCYYDSTSGDLNFSSRATGGWVSELVDETTVVMGKGCDIAYNSSGSHFVVSYYNSTGGDLRYGRRDGGGAGSGCTSTQWNCEDVDTTGVVGEYSSIAINPSNGRTTIAYYDGTVGASQYAYRVGSGGGSGCADTDWTCEAIEDGGVATDYGKYIDLVFQSNGTPHVAYSDESGVADVAL
ncbi:MAG TPA: hypothetical protein VJA22_00755, partial [Patescibacteria group bacterium]|nr:hypothetical protein [Patescibacteria group bacterium]